VEDEPDAKAPEDALNVARGRKLHVEGVQRIPAQAASAKNVQQLSVLPGSLHAARMLRPARR